MKLSLKWLRDFVAYDGPPAALADLLTFAGVEVEAVHTRGVAIDHVVVAQVLDSKPHPNADRLSVCHVDDGSGHAPRQIVCGAKNYQVGDKIPLALPGAVLPGDFKIKAGKLRGEVSEGMMCSAKELGLGEDQSGLLILPPASRVGAPIAELFPAETIFEIEVTPNRPDLLSHVGVAREISALTGRPLTPPAASAITAKGDPGLTVSIDANAQIGCPFYTGTRVDGVRVGPSPAWLRERLESIGLRPINNIVDVTNYVMFELGQPLHAFDAAKLQGGGIRVRLATPLEELKALDGRSYKLAPHQVVIGDAAGHAGALGGVMGGEDSGVTEATTSIVLESAYFLPSLIRRTTRETGLSSDSSYRFERGVDAGGVVAAAHRALELILQTAGGTMHPLVAAGSVDALSRSHDVPIRWERCAAILGIDVAPERIEKILSALGLVKSAAGWLVPSYRRDLQREIDLIEEIARVVGLDAVTGRALGRATSASDVDREYDFHHELRRRLVGLGFFETRSVSLVSQRDLDGSTKAPALRNPISEDQTALRPSLLPGLRQVAARNARAGRADLRLFELGRVFDKSLGLGVREPVKLALLMTGAATRASWRGADVRALDLHDLRGVIESLVGQSRTIEFGRAEESTLLLAVDVTIDGKSIGHAGQLSPATAAGLDLRTPVLVAELDADALQVDATREVRFTPLPRFPAVARDIAMLADLALPHAKIAETISAAREPLLIAAAPFDLFVDPNGVKLPADKKSVAYSLTYRAEDRTLTNEEVNAAHTRVKQKLTDVLAVQFRE